MGGARHRGRLASGGFCTIVLGPTCPGCWSGVVAGWVPHSWPAAVGVSAGLSLLSLIAAFPASFRRIRIAQKGLERLFGVS